MEARNILHTNSIQICRVSPLQTPSRFVSLFVRVANISRSVSAGYIGWMERVVTWIFVFNPILLVSSRLRHITECSQTYATDVFYNH